jgi:hypothetical protein
MTHIRQLAVESGSTYRGRRNSLEARVLLVVTVVIFILIFFILNKLPIKQEVKYPGLHLDKKLTWQIHIKSKRRQLELKVRNMNWLINTKSQLSLENKITIHKAIIKPVWTYGIELWGCSKPSNTKILQTFQSETLRKLANAPWYISNVTLHNDLRIP